MDMRDVASFFDDTEVYDGLTSSLLFNGQLDLFDDAKRDGVGTERRIVSFDPRLNVSMPAHRILKISGLLWVVGDHYHPDDFLGSTIRQKYVVQRASATYEYQSAARWLQNLDPVQEHCGYIWNRDVAHDGTTQVRAYYTLWAGRNSLVLDGDVVKFQNRFHYVQNSYTSPTGFMGIEVLEMATDALQDVKVYLPSSFDPVLGESTAGGTMTIKSLVMRYYEEYRLVSRAMLKPKAGDLMIRVLRTALPAPKEGTRVDVQDVPFKLQTYLLEADGTWLLHLTR